MQHRASIWFVFTVVLIDMIGFGVIMPVLPRLIMQLGRIDVGAAAVWAGWLGAGYAAMQFIFAPIIGNLSDRFGRRPVLLAALLGYGIDYAVMGFAPSLGWLVAGRMIAGLTGASYSAAYAYIADVTPPDQRAQGFGKMSMAFGFGFIIGPALGGLLGEMDLRLPFFFAAALALINFLFGLLFLKESLAPENRRPLRLAQANTFSALKALSGQSSTVLWFVAALTLWLLAHLVYPTIWSYFAIAAYGWSEGMIGFSLMLVGVSSALVQGFVLPRLIPRIGEVRSVVVGVSAVVAVSLVYVVTRNQYVVLAAILFNGLQGLVMPSINALNSRAVDARSQGELQGATQAIGSLAQIVGPPFYTMLFAHFTGPAAPVRFPAAPLVASAVIAVAMLALFLTGARRLRRAAPA